jgi:dipeptidyl aminopeptidase/acylaminoacyl peptidase
VDAIARAGYIVFRSDYRGHGNSQGDALGGYGKPDNTIDVLNAVASIKRYKDADPNRIGMWGHSMGGQMTLRAMVVSKGIRAGVIWSGVVASYADLLTQWKHSGTNFATPTTGRRWRQDLIAQYGSPEEDPEFWNSISPNSYLKDLSGPLQLHASETDPEVPYIFSQGLYHQMLAAGKTVEFYSYKRDDHNLSKDFSVAMQRSIAFFDKYVKK